MDTLYVRSLSVIALAGLLLSPQLLAQGPSSAVLSDVEVRQLIARAEPADHTKLSAHFKAMADQYTTEAQLHTSMQRAYTSNMKLGQVGFSMIAHCRRLVATARTVATTLLELADHHGRLATGVPSVAPNDRAGFETGTGARTASDKELVELVARASTASDHRTLAQYFTGLATGYEREASNHDAYANSWRNTSKVVTAPTIAAHCERLATQLREAAKEARAAASMHQEHASTTR